MISSFSPGNFKCFSDEKRFTLGRITVLTGSNGAGKSSFIQSLLLARLASDGSGRAYIPLNGPYQLALGRAADVFNHFVSTPDRTISATATLHDGSVARWAYGTDDEDALVLAILERPDDACAASSGLRSHFTYLTAERIGPRDVNVMDARPPSDVGVGPQGEHAPQVLLQRERERIRPELQHPRTAEEGNVLYLAKQVELWMRELVPGLAIRVQGFEGTNALAVRMSRTGATLDWLRPTNMAFGASYALPVVVAGLLSPAGASFVVENPEAHLHPSAQARIGRFLATLATGGVQVVVETHSDHVLNGIRLAAADDHPLRPEDVVIHHFLSDAGRFTSVEIRVDAGGGLSSWPAGFFDQTEKDLANLARLQRRYRR